jgi:DNA-binding GntR family transcriptional regulator
VVDSTEERPAPPAAAAVGELERPETDGGPIPDLTSRVARVAAPLREQVLEVLQQEIIELRLRPGQRLVERELVERIGVSRTTIREALRQLSAEGLVTTIPQKGAIVAIPSAKDAGEMYEVRALLEGIIACQFTERASDAQVAELREVFTQMERQYEDSREPQQLLRSKAPLYAVLFAGAGNNTVRSILEGFQARVAVLRAATLAAPGRAERSLEEIRAIVEAIEARDPEAARQASIRHVELAARTLFESGALEDHATPEGPE